MLTMTSVVTMLCLGMSAVALAFLNHTDAKRRRTYKLPVYEKIQRRKWAWLVVFLPLLFLMLLGNWAALIMWLAAISLVGWGLAVLKPKPHKFAGKGSEAQM